jgi:superfamily I DNA/RNA helicase
MRFLRSLVGPGRDDLFLAGDPYQRIYGNKVSMRSLGINIVGRSYRLRINYRTTQEILAWASAILTGESPDDMDGGTETLSGYHATMHGEPPRCAGHATKADEIAGLVDAVREWIAAGVEPEDIAVAVRVAQYGRDIAEALGRSGVPAALLGGSQAIGAGVRIGTMHRMKGLEFRCVAVAGVCDGTVPLRNAVTPIDVDVEQHRENLATERNLLFVAATRARDALRVSWHGTPSAFLPSTTASSGVTRH